MTVASGKVGAQATSPWLYREEEGRGKYQPTQQVCLKRTLPAPPPRQAGYFYLFLCQNLLHHLLRFSCGRACSSVSPQQAKRS